MLVWTGEVASAATPEPMRAPPRSPTRPPLSRREDFHVRSALEGERKDR